MRRPWPRAVPLLAVAFSAPLAAEPTDCRLEFERQPDGVFLFSDRVGACFPEMVLASGRQLERSGILGRVVSGAVSREDAQDEPFFVVPGRARIRWRIEFGEPFEVPPTIATRFRRIASSQPRGPDLIEKCSLTETGFELVVSWEEPYELYAIAIDWVAYELDPPVTPRLCQLAVSE